MFFEKNYMKMDMYRAFFNWKWPFCIILAAFCFFWGGKIGTPSHIEIGVLEMISSAFFGGMMWLAFIPCVFVYGDCLCEDYERKFYRMAIQRGNLHKYIFSKFICGFFCACSTMFLGFLLFCFYAGFFHPFYSMKYTYDSLCLTLFGSLLHSGYHIFYYILLGLLYSLLAGILVTASMALSMWYPNRLLVYALPVFLFYIIESATGTLTAPFQFLHIFEAVTGNCWNNTFLSVGWVLLNTFLSCCMIYFSMYLRIRMWIENG